MGLNYGFSLYFHVDKALDVLQGIAQFMDQTRSQQTRVILPDGRECELSLSSFWGVPETIQVKTMEPIGFDASFRFPVDDALLEHMQSTGRELPAEQEPKLQGLFKMVFGQRYAAPETTLDLSFKMLVGKRYVRCSFTATSSSVSRLFLESQAIPRRLFQLLVRHEGIIGLLDVETNRWFLLPTLTECIEVWKNDIDRAYAASEIVPTPMGGRTAYVPHLVVDVDGWLDLLLSLEIQATPPPDVYVQALETLYKESYYGLGPSFRRILEWGKALDAPSATRLDSEARAKYERGLDRIDGAFVRACGDYSSFEGPYRRGLMAGLGSVLSSQCRAYYYAGLAYLVLSAARTGLGYNTEAVAEAHEYLERARRFAKGRIEIEAVQLFFDLARHEYSHYARHLEALGPAANDCFRVQLVKLTYMINNQRDQAYEQYERALALASNDDQRLTAHFAILAKPEGLLRRGVPSGGHSWTVSEEMLARQMTEPEILEQIMAIVGELPAYKERHEYVSELLRVQVPVTD